MNVCRCAALDLLLLPTEFGKSLLSSVCTVLKMCCEERDV